MNTYKYPLVVLVLITLVGLGSCLSGGEAGSAAGGSSQDFDPSKDLRVHVLPPAGCDSIYLWYDINADGTWETKVIGDPETLLSPEGNGWFQRTFKNTSALQFLFNGGTWEQKLAMNDGSDFSWKEGPGEVWISPDGSMDTYDPVGTNWLHVEKPLGWPDIALVARVNGASFAEPLPLEQYRPGWYRVPPQADLGSMEFYFTSGEQRLPQGKENFFIGRAQSWWVSKDGHLATVDTWVDPASEIVFDSQDSSYKSPYGAVPLGTPITWALEAPLNLISSAKLILQKQIILGDRAIRYETAHAIPLVPRSIPGGQRWEAQFTLPTMGVHGYYFEIVQDGMTRYLANEGKKVAVAHYRLPLTGGRGVVHDSLPAESQFIQTVYKDGFTTPEWAKDAVFYYIFPDRFRNGNQANDPRPGLSYFYDKKPVEFHTNWLDWKPWRPGTSDGSSTDDGEWNNDFYGGDLAGIEEKLDYIASLGANTIYLNPIFEAPSNHKYDTSDYLRVDDGFGTNEEFQDLCREAEKRGIRIILDASFNHSGADSQYMDRFGKYPGVGAFENQSIRTDSPYYDWYEFKPGFTNPDNAYNQWANPTLANLNEASESLKDFLFRSQDSVTKVWLRAGASGWRMDVTPWVSDGFWRQWRNSVKEQDPQAYTVAETWWDSSKYLLGDMFDGTMNYIFRQAVYDFVSGEKTGPEALAMLEMIRENYPPEAHQVLMNLLSTHDASRALHRFGYQTNGGPGYALASQKLKLAFLIQMTYPGAPALFYGDEVGLTGGDDPDNRGPYPWADRGGSPDLALAEVFSQLSKLRAANPVLTRGSIKPLDLGNSILAWERTHGTTKVWVVVNNSPLAKTVEIALGPSKAKSLVDLLQGDYRVQTSNDQGALVARIEVPPYWGRVMEGRGQ